jgi:hypothetical protein
MSRKLAMNELGKEIARQMAEEIVNVQPMPSDAFQALLDSAKSEDDLVKEGYKPVSRFKLLWYK